ncbi:MAG: sodium-dependent transporter [Limisphaerales bacterium]
MTSNDRGQWKSRLGFIFAAAGSAIGLGNIWRFPYVVGENGGSAFLVVYLLMILFLGLPVLIGEVMLGKASQRDPVGAFEVLDRKGSPWRLIGFMGVLAAFMILAFYSVVAGWCIEFIIRSLSGAFSPDAHPALAAQAFNVLTSSPEVQIYYLGFFLLMVVGIVYAGVQSGLQRWCEILMPLFLLILVALIFFAMTQPGAKEGVKFLLQPDWSKLDRDAVLAAMGQCFFSLSLGMGAMLTYGSYLRKEDNVVSSAAWVTSLDTGIAIFAGFAIFPIVFSFGIDPGHGPGLVFVSLPVAFQQLPAGTIVALAFFVLLLAAALTSAISLLEVISAYFVDEFKMPRHLAAIMFGLICFLMGVGVTYSGKYLDFLDGVSAKYLLPLGALFISLFVGWRLDQKIAQSEFADSKFAKVFKVWLFCVRFVAPVLIALVFLNKVGFFAWVARFSIEIVN